MRKMYTEAEERLLQVLAEVSEQKGISLFSLCKAIAPLLERSPNALMVRLTKMKKEGLLSPSRPEDSSSPVTVEEKPARPAPSQERPNPYDDEDDGFWRRRVGEPVESVIPPFLEEDVLVEPDLNAIIDVEVKSLRPYGAIVEDVVTKWRGLLHISEIAYRYIDDIRKYVQEGQILKVVVIKSPDGRKACSLKRLPFALKGMYVAERDPKYYADVKQEGDTKSE